MLARLTLGGGFCITVERSHTLNPGATYAGVMLPRAISLVFFTFSRICCRLLGVILSG